MPKPKHISLNVLHKRAWQLQSEYIRRSERGICYTCRIKKPWAEQDTGHYIHRNSLDFDLINLHCQCSSCNFFFPANIGVYAERLIAEYGKEALIDLRQRANQVKKFTIGELELLILKYKGLLKTLEER